jgi:predicted permease
VEAFVQDVRFTLRHMGKHAGLSAVIALSLALGIGANTAIFGLIRGVILQGLPVQDPTRLVLLHWGADTWPAGLVQSGSGGPRGTRWRSTSRSLPFPFYREIAGDPALFASVIAFAPLGISRQNVTLAAGGLGERVDGEMVSGSFFTGLGVTASAGRVMSEADERADARVAVLSHAYWIRRFAADPNVVGTTITINNLPFAVVGVARAGFFGVQPGRRPDVWIPFVDAPEVAPWGYRPAGGPSLLTVRDYWWVQVMARLKDGTDARQVAAEADSRFQRFVTDALPRVDRERPPRLGFEPGAGGLDMVRGTYQRPLYVLMGMVGIVLLIACANVAVLLLSGSTARRREFALRLSLGAGRSRLVRQLLTESLMMATAGGLLGLLFAGWTSRGLLYLLPVAQRPIFDNSIDAGVLAFAAAVSAATALLFGIVPALVGTRVDLLPALKQSASGTVASDHPAHRIWSSTLVVAQIALSLVLLVAAALFVRTINHLHAQPLGVEHDRLLVFGMDPSQNGYAGDRLAAIYGEMLQRLQAVPGVQSATATRHRLFSGWVSNGPIHIPGEQPKTTGMMLFSNAIGPTFARTTGLTLLAGRDLTWDDINGRRRVAVVNDAMAQYFFGNASAVVGRRFGFGTKPDPASEYEIVGIVSDAKYGNVDGAFPRTAYLPYTANRAALGELHLIVRTNGDPLHLAAAAREAVRRVDSNISVVNLDSMANQIDDSLWRERLFARLTSTFGLLALTLACVGLYGTIAYGVGRRRAEFAVRAALGAARPQILWMVLRRALLLAAGGVALGIPLSLWSGRFIAAQLVGVTTRDPAAFVAGAAILIAVAGLAGYIPARRATLIEPAAALKQE